MVLAPLGEVGQKLAAFAGGNREATIEGADEMCEELQSIVASVEVLREKAAADGPDEGVGGAGGKARTKKDDDDGEDA
jgi:hypothetical protein